MRVHKSSNSDRRKTANLSGTRGRSLTSPGDIQTEPCEYGDALPPEGLDDLERAESPDLFVTPKMRLETLKLYLECNSHKLLVDRQRQKNFFEHVLSLVLVVAMCLFVAFVVWIVLFMKTKVQTQTELEDLKKGGPSSMFF